MEILKIKYLFGDKVLHETDIKKVDNASFIESLMVLKRTQIDNNEYRVIERKYSNDGNTLIMELDVPLPYVGIVTEIKKRQ